MRDLPGHASCWAEAPIKIARVTLTIKLDGNWSSFQLANNTPPLSVTGSVIAPSARMSWRRRETTCAGHSLGQGVLQHAVSLSARWKLGPPCPIFSFPSPSRIPLPRLLRRLRSILVALHGTSTLLAAARKLAASREILLWMTPSEAPKALQASECSELLDPMRASCWISAQH